MGETSIATEKKASDGQLRQIRRMISDAVAKGGGNAANNLDLGTLTVKAAQQFLERGDEIAQAIRSAAEAALREKCNLGILVSFYSQLAEWAYFYQVYFNSEYAPPKFESPPMGNTDYKRLIAVGPHVTENHVYDACQRKFPCRKEGDVDLRTALHSNTRDMGWNNQRGCNGYVVFVKDIVGVDQKQCGVAANNLFRKKHCSETLLERLLHELKYFDETGEHLDPKTTTLCLGSDFGGGFVPTVSWRNNAMYIGCCHPEIALDTVGYREVIEQR